MAGKSNRKEFMSRKRSVLGMVWCLCVLAGCQGYSSSGLYRQDVSTVYVEMFDTGDFRRGYEFTLTDAICKRIEAQTPYKIVSDRNVADTVLSGTVSLGVGILAGERWTGRPLEQETMVSVTVTWKNLKTGQLLVDGKTVYGSSSYSSQVGQTIDYAADRAINKVSQKVVELMEQPW
jgi:hypothetical protein